MVFHCVSGCLGWKVTEGMVGGAVLLGCKRGFPLRAETQMSSIPTPVTMSELLVLSLAHGQ